MAEGINYPIVTYIGPAHGEAARFVTEKAHQGFRITPQILQEAGVDVSHLLETNNNADVANLPQQTLDTEREQQPYAEAA